jgi:dTDP-4-amino-4,6-dideoxygalactose transaminase
MIPFSPPRIDQKIIDEVIAALKSGWITTGPRVKLFEEKLTAYGGHKATLCLNSASSGLELMLRWFGVQEGDEVIVPAYTYAATANVVIHCGARPVFVDTGDDFNVSAPDIEMAITEKTKVIIPVDLAGFPCDYDQINALVERTEIKSKFKPATKEQEMLNRILVLSDAAHSLGAVYRGKRTGCLADITVYSFHAVKNLTTAEGGAVCLNLPEPFDNSSICQNLRIKSLHGQSKDAYSKQLAGGWKYDILEPGYKFNMTDIAAAMGLIELDRYDDDMIVRRKQIFDTYTDAFSKYEWAQLPVYETPVRTGSCHVFLLRVNGITEQQRDVIIQKIYSKGVSVNVHFIPLPMMTYYKGLGFDIRHYPESLHNYCRVISLPVYYNLTDDQVLTVIEAVVSSAEEVLKK